MEWARVDATIRRGFSALTQCYAIQTKCYKDLEALALDHARALVAPKLDIKHIQALLEQRLDALGAMAPLIEKTRGIQADLCARMGAETLEFPRLAALYGEEPEFIQFKKQAEIHKQLLERMIDLDRANEQVTRERMSEMKAAGKALALRTHARKAYKRKK
jgi:hypothetical protein